MNMDIPNIDITQIEALADSLEGLLEGLQDWLPQFTIPQTVGGTLLALFMFITMWAVYNKGHESGWILIIPVYNRYVKFRLARSKGLFWGQLLAGFLWLVLYAAGLFVLVFLLGTYGAGPDKRMLYLMLILFAGGTFCLLLVGIMNIVLEFRVAKAFRRGFLFGLGLLFLPIIFYPIIAFNGNIHHYRDAIPHANP